MLFAPGSQSRLTLSTWGAYCGQGVSCLFPVYTVLLDTPDSIQIRRLESMELKVFFLVNVTVTAYSHKCHPQFLFYSPCIMFIMHFTYVISTMHCNYFYFRQFSFSAVTNRNEWDFISSSLMSSPPHPFYFSAVLVST